MNRHFIVVGDPLANGGRVLPYTGPEFTIHGHQVALIGGRAYCESCNSVGLIAKAGGPRRGFLRGAEMALDGDVVVCQCPQHQPVVATLTNSSSYDDTDCGSRDLTAAPVLANYGSVLSSPMAAAKRVVDEHFEHAPEHEPTLEAICPNMTNKAFAELVLALRDEAVALVIERLQELERWNKVAQERILKWFGDPGLLARGSHLHDTRDYLKNGLIECDRVLRGLKPENFVRWSPTAHKHLNCVNTNTDAGLVAEVCKPDRETRTIAIAQIFCTMPRDYKNFDTRKRLHRDTQLLTLIHEITHFEDVFNSTDPWYGTSNALTRLAQTKDFATARTNADSLGGYILGIAED